MFKFYNPNPQGKNVGDCVIRAITKIFNRSWEQIYLDLCIQGYIMSDWGSANAVWGAYLKSKGFERRLIPDDYLNDYTVEEFCKDNPNGDYILALSSHVICVKNGDYYDSWDSGKEIPLYYWERVSE